MKFFTAVRAYVLLLAALALLAGCSYAVTTAEVPVPKPGPQIKAGLKAKMPPVIDKRFWPPATPGVPDPNVHIFAPAITTHLRGGLQKTGLFAALPLPGTEAASGIGDTVEITVNTFALTKLGNNPWAAGAYIIDGLIQPVSGVALIATQGQIDAGAYLLPSTHAGTTINAELVWVSPGIKEPVLKRAYQVQVELGSVSERQLRASLSDTYGYGIKVGKAEGVKTLDELVQTIARDPRWLYLNSYVRLAQARQVIKDPEATPEARLAAAQGLLGILQPLPYSPEEVKALRDGVISASGRAGLVNSLRARYQGLKTPDGMPAAQLISEKQAEQLFDSPAVGRALAKGEVTQEALSLIMNAIIPRSVKKGAEPSNKPAPGPMVQVDSAGGSRNPAPGAAQAAADAPKAPAEPAPLETLSPQALKMQAQLIGDLAMALRGHARLQAVYLSVADTVVGPAWPLAKAVLGQVNSPQVKVYLAKREAS